MRGGSFLHSGREIFESFSHGYGYLVLDRGAAGLYNKIG